MKGLIGEFGKLLPSENKKGDGSGEPVAFYFLTFNLTPLKSSQEILALAEDRHETD